MWCYAACVDKVWHWTELKKINSENMANVDVYLAMYWERSMMSLNWIRLLSMEKERKNDSVYLEF